MNRRSSKWILSCVLLSVGLFFESSAQSSSLFGSVSPIASIQSGDWTDPTTWQGGTVPGSGDNAILSDGHTVTIPAGSLVLVGTSPANDESTPALQPSSNSGNGVLVVEGTLRFRGTIKQGNARWSALPGSRLEHDSSLASSPTSYTWQIGLLDNQPDAVLHLAGSGPGLSRVHVTNAAGSSRFGGFHNGTTYRANGDPPWMYNGLLGAGRLEATYTTFTSLGSSSTEWLTTRLGPQGHQISLEHCLIEDSGAVVVLDIYGLSVFRFASTSTLDPISETSVFLEFEEAIGGSGLRLIQDAVIEGVLSLHQHRDLDVLHSVLAGRTDGPPPVGNNTYSGHFRNVTDTLVYNRNTIPDWDTPQLTGRVRRLVSLRSDTQSSTDGDHFRGSPPTFPEETWTDIDGVVAEYEGTSTGGEIFIFQPGSQLVPYRISVRNVLVLPNGAGTSSRSDSICAIVGGNSDALDVTVENNTACGASGVFFMELTTTSVPGVVRSVQNNLNWNHGGQGRIVSDVGNTLTDETIVSADYNNTFNINPDPYSPADEVFENSPGINDLAVAPQFVDDTRDFLSWGQSIDPGHQTWAGIYSEIRKKNNDSGFDPRYDWSHFYDWAREGFRPTHPALESAGFGGQPIGAVPMAIFSDGFESGDVGGWLP